MYTIERGQLMGKGFSVNCPRSIANLALDKLVSFNNKLFLVY